MDEKNNKVKQKIISLLSQKDVGRKKVLDILNQEHFIFNLDQKSQLPLNCIGFWENCYPEKLRNTTDFPLLLFLRGDASLLLKPSISIVGTRAISEYGRSVINEILNFTSDEIIIVSGLAYGVDGAVHRKALEKNIPTIAVVAGGLDGGYPAVNARLYREISERGLIVAEFPKERTTFKGMFPMRNRIIAGLSDITIIVEADLKSGSLITARYALDYGRDVYVIPGSIFNSKSKGTNDLIKDGAGIITSRDELIHIINTKYKLNLTSRSLHTINSDIDLEHFGDREKYPDGFTNEQLVSRSKLNSSQISRILTKLEMDGILIRSLSGRYILKDN